MNSLSRSAHVVDWRVLAATGTGMIALAAAFLWNDLQVQPEVLVVAASVFAAGLAVRGKGRRPLVGPLALFACTLAGGLWFVLGRSPVLLVGLGASWGASLVGIIRGGRAPETTRDRIHNVLLWHGFVLATAVATSALYFQFLTLGMPDLVERRLVLTMAWLLGGLVMLSVAGRTGQRAARDAAFALVGLSVAKALIYDSTHLSGMLRVGEFAFAGVLLWTGAWAAARNRSGAPS
jgi:uncharacterized membrane protein